MNHCKECIYFRTHSQYYEIGTPDILFGDCKCPKLRYDVPRKTDTGDELLYQDSEGYFADLYVGQDFGCIHFQPSNNPQKEEK